MLFFIQFFAIEFYHSTVFFQLIAIIFVELAIYLSKTFFMRNTQNSLAKQRIIEWN